MNNQYKIHDLTKLLERVQKFHIAVNQIFSLTGFTRGVVITTWDI